MSPAACCFRHLMPSYAFDFLRLPSRAFFVLDAHATIFDAFFVDMHIDSLRHFTIFAAFFQIARRRGPR